VVLAQNEVESYDKHSLWREAGPFSVTDLYVKLNGSEHRTLAESVDIYVWIAAFIWRIVVLLLYQSRIISNNLTEETMSRIIQNPITQ
jgi:hypothetical protein